MSANTFAEGEKICIGLNFNILIISLIKNINLFFFFYLKDFPILEIVILISFSAHVSKNAVVVLPLKDPNIKRKVI